MEVYCLSLLEIVDFPWIIEVLEESDIKTKETYVLCFPNFAAGRLLFLEKACSRLIQKKEKPVSLVATCCHHFAFAWIYRA